MQFWIETPSVTAEIHSQHAGREILRDARTFLAAREVTRTLSVAKLIQRRC